MATTRNTGRENVLSQTNFTGGVFSPRLRMRSDLQKYDSAVENSENMIIVSHGGMSHRSGTRYVATVKNSAHNTRLIPFIFSTTRKYILEFGNQYIRVFKDEAQILDPTSPNPPYEVPGTIPWLHTEVFGITYVQSAESLYLCHGDHKIQVLTRTSDTSWSIADYASGDGPYRPENTNTSLTITPSGTTGAITLTASAVLWASTDVGRIVRIKHATNWGYATITGYTSTTVVNATVVNAFDTATASSIWRLGAWSGTTGYPQGWPTFINNRIGFCNTNADPNWFWLSEADDFSSHAPSDPDGTVVDSHAIAKGINDRRVNAIHWLLSDNEVLVGGTSDGPYKIWSGTSTDIISPTKIGASNQTRSGSNSVGPALTSDTILYISRGGRKIRELVYSINSDKRVSPDISILAEHVTKTGVKEMTFQEEPDSIVWFCCNDGRLVGLTYMKDQAVVAFHDHPLGGTDVEVKSLAVVPNVAGDGDTVYMIVSRTINGATVQTVEFLEEQIDFDDLSDWSDAFHVDCGLSYSGASTDTITGLDHLEGEEVSILANGATHPRKTVASGQITLDRETTKCHVGLPHRMKLKQLPREVATVIGSSIGRTKLVTKVSLRLYQSIGGSIGPDEDTQEPLIWRDESMVMGSAPPLFTGDKSIEYSGDYETDGGLYLINDQPTPFTVLGITSLLSLSER